MRKLVSTIVLVVLASACSPFQPVEMRLPSNLATQSARLPIDGFGGWTHGRFRTGDWYGGYERSEERLSYFGTFIQNSGHSEFTIKGPGVSSSIEAFCRMREKVLDLEVAEFKPKRMSYRCEFTADGRGIPARFELQEVRTGLGGALNRYERRGEIALGGETVQIRSVHKLAGSPIEMASPIGYVFEKRGRAVGAIELNGSPVLYIQDLTDEGLSRTITIGAIALAAFWDPANSSLGE